ncbi:MAG: aminoacyl-histidine dipeptidase [Oscillospiraceae bacterium]|nr:aminoacyl-histidine dipeptidase [Oscillospiraceae bacterium]
MNWTDEAILSGVIPEFRALSARPHGSGREAAQRDWLSQRLAALGGTTERDPAGNLKADFPATPGLEQRPLLMVQGHMDMVCAVLPGGDFRPEEDPVTVVEEDDFLKSDGRSSLGADNGLAIAVLLWLLEQKTPHGPLRVLLTVSEEVGLRGAMEVDKSWLADGACLINMDGFQGSTAVVSSASGTREHWTRPLALQRRSKSWAFRLALDGFAGGHSGFDIDKGRANPIQLLAGFLKGAGVEVAELTGGHSFNAIPMSAGALVVADDPEAFQAAAGRWADRWRADYAETDPEGRLTVTAEPLPRKVWKGGGQTAILDFLARLTIGAASAGEDGQVLASANLGQVWAEDGVFHAAAFIRGNDPEKETEVRRAHIVLSLWNDFTGEVERYPGWPGGRSNRLGQALSRLSEAQNGRPLALSALHVGLEPAVFLEKNPKLVMASIGPDILDAHSVSERVPLASIPPFVRLLAGALEDEGCCSSFS